MENLIVCTGFDIFDGHNEKNASWEAVQLLPDSVKFKDKNFLIKKLKIPVTYEGVDKAVPEIWCLNPKLVIHCGVSSQAEKITLEACAYNLGYCRPDFNSKYLPDEKASLCKQGKDQQILLTNFNIGRIAKELNQVESSSDDCKCSVDEADNAAVSTQDEKSKYECSKNVGSYLCGYIYLKSLDHSLDRSLFIHVPEVGKPMTSKETRDAIFQVIHKCLEQLDEVKLL